MAESEVLKNCLEFLKANKIFCWRNNTGAIQKGGRWIKFGFNGSSDILGITPDGRFLAVECKREKGGIISDAQKEFLFNITKAGGVAIIANSLEALQEGLKINRVLVN